MGVFAFALLLAICLSEAAFSDDLKRIELDDGSILTGEVLSMEEGVYRIHSPTLGVLALKSSQVRSISPAKSVDKGGPSPESAPSGDLQNLLVLMIQDSEIMDAVFSLRDDPDLNRVLEDPAVMDAVGKGDPSGLMQNPGILKLMNHPKVREIINRLEK